MIVDHDRALGRETPESIRKIAQAVLRVTQRSADRGADAAALRRQVNEAEQAGDTEEAAALLAELIDRHGDGDGSLESRLRSLPPPPPAHVLATPQEDTVRVEWQAAPTQVRHVRYRVVRCSGRPAGSPSAGLTVAETADLSAVDRAAPNGVRLYYTVFATRGADAWSAGTSAAEVLRLPEVTDFRLEAQPDAIAGSWRVALGSTDVVVIRTEGSPPDSAGGHQVPAGLAGFLDTGLQRGTRYYYRACAVYVNDAGERWQTPGVVGWATPETPLDAEEHHASSDRAVDPVGGHTAGVLAHIEETFADHPDKARTDAPDATHSSWSVRRSGSTGGRFVLKKGTSGKYHFDLVAANGQVIATSETYERKMDALRGIESVKRDALDAQIEDRPGAAD
jgi:uncharacterized protein YegP (UPF0339 family)